MPSAIIDTPPRSEAFEAVKLKTSAITALRTLSYELSRRTGKRVTFSETLVVLSESFDDADLDNLARHYNEMHRHTA
jgi:hypothetical protein